MSNKDHIETIKRYGEEYEWAKAAIRALKFEDAAEPKDAAVEREHCREAIAETDWEPNAVVRTLERERALARAEVEAKYARLIEVGKRVDEEALRGASGAHTRETLRELQAALRELGKIHD